MGSTTCLFSGAHALWVAEHHSRTLGQAPVHLRFFVLVLATLASTSPLQDSALRCRPNIPFSVTVNYPALIFCSFYVFYTTLGFFLSRHFKVLVADFAVGIRLPVRVSLVGPMVKNPPANAGEAGSIPGSERSLEEEMTTFSSILTSPGNPMDAGAWWAAVHGVTESQTQLSE